MADGRSRARWLLCAVPHVPRWVERCHVGAAAASPFCVRYDTVEVYAPSMTVADAAGGGGGLAAGGAVATGTGVR
jgi:hypothetical protein